MTSLSTRRNILAPIVALSITGLLATTASAAPLSPTTVTDSYVIVTTPRDVDVDIQNTALGRAQYTNAPVVLNGSTNSYVMLPGKDTKQANFAIEKSLPGYNTFRYFAPLGDNPDLDDLDLAHGYRPDQLFTLYRADIPEKISYINVLSGFTTAKKNTALMRQNLETTLAINNNASLVQIQRAVADSNEENILTMSDAMGEHMGKIFRNLYESGRLPKVAQLMGGDMARGFNFTNATALEKIYYDNDRPIKVAPQRIKYYYEDMDDLKEDDGYKNLVFSYPSGHTNRAYIKGILLSIMLPEIAPQLLTRASEVGYNRMVMGVHYPLDVIGGRMTAQASMAWHMGDVRFRSLILEARKELRHALEKTCGTTIAHCAQQGQHWLSTSESIRLYTERMTYRLPRIGRAHQALQVPQYAADLLRTAFPQLTTEQRTQLLVATALDSGYPLDISGPDGGWQRLNFAKAFAAHVQVKADGGLIITLPR